MGTMIDPIFHMYKIKHSVLDKLQILSPNTGRVHIYINLETVFNKIVNPRINNYLTACAGDDGYLDKFKLGLISHIINLAQHYKLYFAKKGVESRAILFWNYPARKNYTNRQYILNYRSYYNHKIDNNEDCRFLTECIKEAVKLLKKMIVFINEVYLIDGGEVDSSLVPLIMENNVYNDYTNVQKIIVSDSKYDFQYVNYDFTVIQSAKDDSCIVNKDTVIDLLKTQSGIKSVLTAPPQLLPFVLALLGDRHRDIPKLAGVGLATILKMANKAIQANAITENTTDVDMLTKIISAQWQNQFRDNYLCTNLDYQMKNINPLQISLIKQQVVDKFDDRTLKRMNEMYFIHYPIMTVDMVTDKIAGTYDKQIASPFRNRK